MSEEDYDDLYKRFVDNSGDAGSALRLLASVSRNISEVADNYRGNGPDLMWSVDRILHICSWIAPSIENISVDFDTAWRKFTVAEAHSLGDAFDIHRPKHSDQEAERFRRQNAVEIYEKVKSKVDAGLSVAAACRDVAVDLPRGHLTIRNIYEDMEERMEYLWAPRAARKNPEF